MKKIDHKHHKSLNPPRHIPNLYPDLDELSKADHQLSPDYLQVTNPNVGDQQPPTIPVFRLWLLEEARKAVEGVISPQKESAIWIHNMEGNYN